METPQNAEDKWTGLEQPECETESEDNIQSTDEISEENAENINETDDEFTGEMPEDGEDFEIVDLSQMSREEKLEFLHEFREKHTQHMLGLIYEWIGAISRWVEEIRSTGNAEPDNSPQHFFIRQFYHLFEVEHEKSEKQGCSLADKMLAQRYEFSLYEVMVLWLLASVQLDQRIRPLLQAIDFNAGGAFTTSILMQVLTTDQEERNHLLRVLAPNAKLSFYGFLITPTTCNPALPLNYEIRVPQQVAYYLTDVHSLSVRLSRHAELLDPRLPEEITISKRHEETLKIISNYFERPSFDDIAIFNRHNLNAVPSLAFYVEGTTGSGRSTLVKIIANRLHRSMVVVNCVPLVSLNVDAFEEFISLAFFEAELLNAILCFRNAVEMMNDQRMTAQIEVQLRRRHVAVAFCIESGQETLSSIDPCIAFKTKIEFNTKADAENIWRNQVRMPFLDISGLKFDEITNRLSLHPFQIQNASKLAYYQSSDVNENGTIQLSHAGIVRAAAIQMKKNIGGLAFVSDPKVDMNEVIVNSELSRKLNQIVGSALHRREVLQEWGIGKRIKRGTGIIALFDGEPGTGKTHSAEAIAKKLGLSLMRINTASIVDKYIGETEKNLTKIFSQARPDMSLILFDEADSLFAKRTTNVSKSNDRYSNMSINVLLQLIERFEGVSILTTNLKVAIDPAFERRITYKVYFPMPEKPERVRLWKYLCPPYVPTEEPIDYPWLAELELSGGEIKNAVLTASYKAATQGKLLNTEFLYDAAISEASSTGRVMRRGGDEG